MSFSLRGWGWQVIRISCWKTFKKAPSPSLSRFLFSFFSSSFYSSRLPGEVVGAGWGPTAPGLLHPDRGGLPGCTHDAVCRSLNWIPCTQARPPAKSCSERFGSSVRSKMHYSPVNGRLWIDVKTAFARVWVPESRDGKGPKTKPSSTVRPLSPSNCWNSIWQHPSRCSVNIPALLVPGSSLPS